MRGAFVFLALALATEAGAQALPFDMGPERVGLPARAKVERLTLRPRQAEAVQARRYLLSLSEPRLMGETATRSWSVYLTAAEAAAATLNLGFTSSIFVAPEASRLRLSINGTPVIDTAIRAAQTPASIAEPLPAGVLRPGPNVFTLEARQRHRTDCTIESTHDLWTDLDRGRTFLAYEDISASRPKPLSDILATGVDASGATRMAILTPEGADPMVTAGAMRLAQVLGAAIGGPRTVVSLHDAADAAFASAGLRVAFGSAAALGAELGLPIGAVQKTVAEFADSPSLGSVLVVGAARRDALGGAIAEVADGLAPAARGVDSLRTAAWQLPDAPLIEAPRRLDFETLGVPSQEFTGQRTSVGFQLALPADFYAQNYGEAELVLDAAYAPEVLPGSRIDIYVNGSLASTMPIATSGGGIMRHVPIDVTMRHLRPGLNDVRLDAVMETAGDQTCAPGSVRDTPRFALFDSSAFVIPRFARLGQLPDLAATTGRGFPYATGAEPVALVLGDASEANRSAAATLLAKVAQSSGRVIPVEIADPGPELAGADALFIGAVGRFPSDVLTHVGLDATAQGSWSGRAIEAAAPTVSRPRSLDGWRESISAGTWYQPVNAVGGFLRKNAPQLPWWRETERGYRPAAETSVLLAHGIAPAGAATWTLLTAPDPDLLAAGTSEMVRQSTWTRLGGRLTALEEGGERIVVIPAETTIAVATQPWSLANARLVAANWMSGNIVAFSVALSFACLLLGLATRTMLTNLGRRR